MVRLSSCTFMVLVMLAGCARTAPSEDQEAGVDRADGPASDQQGPDEDARRSCSLDRWCSRPLPSGTADLHAVMCIGLDQYLVAGAQGTILLVSDAGISPMDSGTTRALYDLGGSEKEGALAVGERGAIVVLNKGIWTPMSSGTAHDLYAVVGGSGTNNAAAVGDEGTLLRLTQGSGWSVSTDTPLDPPVPLYGVTNANHDLYVVGAASTILSYNLFSYWTEHTTDTTATLHDIWAEGAIDLVAVGTNGTILTRGSDGWTTQLSPTTRTLRALWGSPDGEVFAVGDGGTILRRDVEGQWSLMDSGTTADLHAVGGCSAKHLTAVGTGGVLIQRAL